MLKKRIALIDNNQVVNFPGGIERVLCDFCNFFTEKDYEMALVCMNKEEGGFLPTITNCEVCKSMV